MDLRDIQNTQDQVKHSRIFMQAIIGHI